MKQLKTALFDFDGVVVDTEPIYDLVIIYYFALSLKQ